MSVIKLAKCGLAFVVVALLSFTIGCVPATASEGARAADLCPEVEDIKANVRLKLPDAEFMVLEPPKAKDYMIAFNAVPPVSTYPVPEQLMIIRDPDEANAVFLVGFRNGCLFGHLSIKRSLHLKLMRMVIGPET